MESAAQRLRVLLRRPGLLQAPGCHDGLSARLVERAGFPAGYVTGFGAAASRLGAPDTGLLSFKEMADQVAALADAVAIPLIADADTGYGNAGNVRRTVRAFARAGAAAVQIEDQAWPKRCGHTAGKEVVPFGEAVARVRAAVDARGGPEGVLIVARTDARAPAGFDEALRRCRAFAGAGADVVFLEAPESREEMALSVKEVAAPMLANVLEGGRTPVLPPADLEAMGYRIAIHPLTLLFAVTKAMEDHLRGGPPLRPWEGDLGFEGLRAAVGFPEQDALAARFRPETGESGESR